MAARTYAEHKTDVDHHHEGLMEATRIDVTWGKPTWSSWYRYQEGTTAAAGIDQIWRHAKTGQVRIYSGDDWAGRRVTFNGAAPVVMRARGRHGRLYLSFPN